MFAYLLARCTKLSSLNFLRDRPAYAVAFGIPWYHFKYRSDSIGMIHFALLIQHLGELVLCISFNMYRTSSDSFSLRPDSFN